MKTTNKDIEKAVAAYKASHNRDDNKTRLLDSVSVYALFWQLFTGHFEEVPYSIESFLRYFIIGDERIIELINNYNDKYLKSLLV